MCVGPQINTCAKFCANIFNSKWIMNDKWNSKWRLQPSRIIFGWFWSPGLFSVAVDYITTKKFHLSVSVGGWVIAVCAWIQDGGRRHFRFYVRTIFSHMWMWDSKLNKLAKFCANMCNSKLVMGENEIHNGGHRHVEFIILVDFGHMVYFRWQLCILLQNFIYLCQSAAELLLFVQKCKITAAGILDLIFVQFFGTRVCRTLNVIHRPNFMQTCAIVNELWAINVIQNGGCRHLEFILFVSFGKMVYFWWQPTTLLQNFIHICQSAAELLLFVQKSKMAAATVLDFIFVQYFGTHVCRTSNVVHVPNFVQICATVNDLWAINEI